MMMKTDAKFFGWFATFIVAVAVVAYAMEPESSKENCIYRGGKWDSKWKWCSENEMGPWLRCANFCKGQGLVFRAYKDGRAAFQDERCECQPK